jgi:hypothetical protein
MISSKNERVIDRDLSDLTFQNILNGWWASMNEGSKLPIAWNNSIHAPSWRFYWHCGIYKTGSPGIICIVSHQVLRDPSVHGTSSMGKHSLSKDHIAKLHESTESLITKLTSLTVDETALAILERQESWGITIVSLQRKIIFDIQFNPYWLKWQTKRSKRAAKDFETSEFDQEKWNRYLTWGFDSAHIPCNIKLNVALPGSYQALRDDLVLLSATTLSNICWRQYALTVDGIKKQLPLRSKVSLALDEWTSTNILAIMLVIAYYMDQNWAVCEVELPFDEIDCLFCSHFEWSFRMRA